jgi:hypothetical protein
MANGRLREVVAVNGNAPPEAVRKIAQAAKSAGALLIPATGRSIHAEQAIYDYAEGNSHFFAIGISNYTGPCTRICEPFFTKINTQLAKEGQQQIGLYYLSKFERFPGP